MRLDAAAESLEYERRGMHADIHEDECFTGLFDFALRIKQLPYFDDQYYPSKIDDRDICLGWLAWGPWEEFDRWCFFGGVDRSDWPSQVSQTRRAIEDSQCMLP